MGKFFLAIIGAVLIVLVGAGFVSAKLYKPLGISDSVVEIPDNAVLPDYIYRLEFEKTRYDQISKECVLSLNYYRDPLFQYFDKKGQEIFPYIEIIKTDKSGAHLIGLLFINRNNVVNAFTDPAGLSLFELPTGKLERTSFEGGDEVLRKTPRVIGN